MKTKLYFILFIFIALFSCADENPLLLNPPSQAESVKIRFINLSGDFLPRYLQLDSKKTDNVNYFETSLAMNPPIDSLKPIVVGASSQFKTYMQAKFFRNTIYTCIALPSPENSIRKNAVDTLIILENQPDLPKLTVQSYIRLFNAYNDSTATYKVKYGSASGTEIIASSPYRAINPSYSVLRAGDNPITLIKTVNGKDSTVNTYNVKLDTNSQYTLIVSKNSSGSSELSILNEKSFDKLALKKCEPMIEKIAQIKTLNLSQSQFKVSGANSEILENSISNFFISEYRDYSVSTDSTIDRLIVSDLSGNEINSSIYSLIVNKKYIFAILDSNSQRGKACVVIPEPILDYPSNGYAVVRVLNATSSKTGANVSLGAHADPTDPKAYSAGETICDRLSYSSLSAPKLVKPGIIPASVYSGEIIPKMHFTGKINLTANNNYIIVVYNDDSGNVKLTLINENEQNQNISQIEQCAFGLVFNANSSQNSQNVTLNGYLNNAILYYSGSFQISLSAGTNTISYSGTDYTLTNNLNERFLTILTSSNGQNDLFTIYNYPVFPDRYVRYERYINATDDIEELIVSQDSLNPNQSVNRKNATNYYPFYQEKKSVYVFGDKSDMKELFRLSNFLLPLGKTYSFIVSGSKSKGYKMSFQEEY